MQAIPVNVSYRKSSTNAQRRSSEPHIFINSKVPSTSFGVQQSHSLNPSIINNNNNTECDSNVVFTKISANRVLNRLGIASIGSIHHQSQNINKPKKTTSISNPNTPQNKSQNKPKPNRNLYRMYTPSRSQQRDNNININIMDDDVMNHNITDNLAVNITADPIEYTLNTSQSTKSTKKKHRKQHYEKRINRRKSPIFSSITRESKHKKRSHSFSISRTYSHRNNSKAYSRRLPTHYSPSMTHYTPSVAYSKSPEITPPPQQLPLPPSMSLLHTITPSNHHRKRERSRSESHSMSKSHTKSNNNNNNNNIHNNNFNIAHILRVSDQNDNNENDKQKQPETETIQINNGKSLLFSSWFSAPSLFWDKAATQQQQQQNIKYEKTIKEEDDKLNVNERDIASAIRSMEEINSSLSSNDNNNDNDNDNNNDNNNNDDNIIKETRLNTTFTTGLKPPRKYTADEDESDEGGKSKDELISFRDFLAQENRKALQREVVATENKQENTLESKPNGFGHINKNIERFYILKGNTMKVDYGLPEGPYTLYKFVITFNHEYKRPILKQKSYDNIYDESPRKKTSHWSIRKRYSDFVTFNNNLIAEIKGNGSFHHKTIKLAKLPPKTFKKNFNSSFVSMRHDALLTYLNKIISISELSSSVTLLTFLGALNNHTLPYNDKFLESRMTLSVYVSNYADTGDVLLFETKSYIAASLRSVTASNYDHVGLVYRDINGTHKCDEEEEEEKKLNLNRLYLVESTIDGVRTYPLKKRLKQWSILCPQIVVRRLKLLKPGIDELKKKEWASNSLGSLEQKRDKLGFTKYDYAQKADIFYSRATEFVDRVNGLEYAIWSNVFRLNDVPFEKQKSFFCSQLVTAFFKYMNLLPQNVKTNRILPGHFSDHETNDHKLPFSNCILMPENLLLFKHIPVGAAKHKHHYHSIHRR